ncbi:unnamed protein product [Schistosoma margrebowiei]|uniref:Uncharacterized protein n=1 Tax=Schistosoma margrebowiei TaxID=48269 RepID=A0A183LCK5_9TREM|nr:unnamed protein product [Schistosoma margrebowiei]
MVVGGGFQTVHSSPALELGVKCHMLSYDKLTPFTKSSTTTILNFRSNTLQQSVESEQLCDQISTDIEFTSKLSKEM